MLFLHSLEISHVSRFCAQLIERKITAVTRLTDNFALRVITSGDATEISAHQPFPAAAPGNQTAVNNLEPRGVGTVTAISNVHFFTLKGNKSGLKFSRQGNEMAKPNNISRFSSHKSLVLVSLFAAADIRYTYHLYIDHLYKTRSIPTTSIFYKVSKESTSIK